MAIECVEYSDDIYLNLRKQESNRSLLKARSTHLTERNNIIDELMYVSSELNLSQRIVHLCVHYFDYFLDDNVVDESDVRLCAFTSLVIAAKVDEIDSLIPTYNTLNEVLDYEFTRQQFIEMELSLINAFKWQLVYPTLVTFVEYFADYVILDCEVSEALLIHRYSVDIGHEMNETLRLMCDTAIRDYRFNEFDRACLAAACMAQTRKIFKILPIWPLHLRKITRMDFKSLQLCIQFLQQFYKQPDYDASYYEHECIMNNQL